MRSLWKHPALPSFVRRLVLPFIVCAGLLTAAPSVALAQSVPPAPSSSPSPTSSVGLTCSPSPSPVSSGSSAPASSTSQPWCVQLVGPVEVSGATGPVAWFLGLVVLLAASAVGLLAVLVVRSR